MEIKNATTLTDDKSVIDEIEQIKMILTLTQAAMEDKNYQEAGDTVCTAKMRMYAVTEQISKTFNQNQKNGIHK